MAHNEVTSDDIRMVIDQLEGKHAEKRKELTEHCFSMRGFKAAGYMFGLSYAIGALKMLIREE